jgi:DNA polymerase III subunit gamma/tau
MCLHGRAELSLAPDEYSALVMVLLRMLAFRPGGSGERAAQQPTPPVAAAASASALLRAHRVASISKTLPATSGVGHAAAPAAIGAASTAVTPAVQTTPLGERWNTLVLAMQTTGQLTALTRELAMQAQCVAMDEQQQPALWQLRVERETLSKAAHVEKLQAALAQTLGYAVRLEVQVGIALESPALRAASDKEQRQQQANSLIQSDPLVRSLLAQFPSATIVPGSIQAVR